MWEGLFIFFPLPEDARSTKHKTLLFFFFGGRYSFSRGQRVARSCRFFLFLSGAKKALLWSEKAFSLLVSLAHGFFFLLRFGAKSHSRVL